MVSPDHSPTAPSSNWCSPVCSPGKAIDMFDRTWRRQLLGFEDVKNPPASPLSLPTPASPAQMLAKSTTPLSDPYEPAQSSPSSPPDQGSQDNDANADGVLLRTRTLVLPSDLLFHSHILDHHQHSFCTFFYPTHRQIHYRRLLERRRLGVMSENLILCFACLYTHLSDHPLFQRIDTTTASQIYYRRLAASLFDNAVDGWLDTAMVLLLVSGYTVSEGAPHTAFALESAILRKFQFWRLHLLDHPHPPPLAMSAGSWDATRVHDPLARETLRVMWWSAFGQDAAAALLLGQPSILRTDEIYVRLPVDRSAFEAATEAAICDPEAPIHTALDYPTYLLRTRGLHNPGASFVVLKLIVHEVAGMRDRRRHDPAHWLRTWAPLNQRLDEWHATYGIHFPAVPYITFSSRVHLYSGLPDGDHFYLWTLYYVTRLLLNYPYEADVRNLVAALHEGRTAEYFDADDTAADLSSSELAAILRQSRSHCWDSLHNLRTLLAKSPIIPAMFQFAFCLGALHTTAVACIALGHQAATGPHKAAWATEFVEEILQFLATMRRMWKTSDFAIHAIQQCQRDPTGEACDCLTLKFLSDGSQALETADP
ncbi:hypothetical protein IWQ60_000313 [Tieghemiomyces parasiticus]|uniref:Xylanolytic transcriptional activator regulatory domain-containing protein n=1 Tax=Tieghemiomyces parasiticus TaxID=78921 RepID=A0A9W8E2Z6_9FUNG|nr:hypothetical protein IWQ60_000313 [Tieghemiomyces parasiticus]